MGWDLVAELDSVRQYVDENGNDRYMVRDPNSPTGWAFAGEEVAVGRKPPGDVPEAPEWEHHIDEPIEESEKNVWSRAEFWEKSYRPEGREVSAVPWDVLMDEMTEIIKRERAWAKTWRLGIVVRVDHPDYDEPMVTELSTSYQQARHIQLLVSAFNSKIEQAHSWDTEYDEVVVMAVRARGFKNGDWAENVDNS